MNPLDPRWCARLRRAPSPDPAPPPAEPAYLCDLCGAAMREHHCKIVCHNCGYKRDCSDP